MIKTALPLHECHEGHTRVTYYNDPQKGCATLARNGMSPCKCLLLLRHKIKDADERCGPGVRRV